MTGLDKGAKANLLPHMLNEVRENRGEGREEGGGWRRKGVGEQSEGRRIHRPPTPPPPPALSQDQAGYPGPAP
jgi:hypothetical protein